VRKQAFLCRHVNGGQTSQKANRQRIRAFSILVLRVPSFMLCASFLHDSHELVVSHALETFQHIVTSVLKLFLSVVGSKTNGENTR